MWSTYGERILFVYSRFNFSGNSVSVDNFTGHCLFSLVVLDLISDNIVRVDIADQDVLILFVSEIVLNFVVSN